jgi:hypothetical protein
MSTITFDRRSPSPSIIAAAKHGVERMPRPLRALAAAGMLLIAGQQLHLALQSPAHQIKRTLIAAAEETGRLPWTHSQEQVRSELVRHFADHAVTVDASRFPTAVSVAFQELDKSTCVEANELARRIEGSVVVALEGYRSASDCGDSNTMVWRIMP